MFKHIKNNNGDIYIFFLFIVICMLLLCSVLVGLMEINVKLDNVYSQIENSANTIVNDIKVESYQTLIDGSTNDSNTTYNNEAFGRKFAELLDADYEASNNCITKIDFGDEIMFSINDISMAYENGNLQLTFTINVPIYFNGRVLYTDTETYTKNTSFNFK